MGLGPSGYDNDPTELDITWRHGLTWVVVVDLPRRLILAQAAKPGPTNDGATRRPLLEPVRHLAAVRLVLADGEFDSELNHTCIRQIVGADSSIPAQRGKRTWRLRGIRAQMRAPSRRSRHWRSCRTLYTMDGGSCDASAWW